MECSIEHCPAEVDTKGKCAPHHTAPPMMNRAITALQIQIVSQRNQIDLLGAVLSAHLRSEEQADA